MSPLIDFWLQPFNGRATFATFGFQWKTKSGNTQLKLLLLYHQPFNFLKYWPTDNLSERTHHILSQWYEHECTNWTIKCTVLIHVISPLRNGFRTVYTTIWDLFCLFITITTTITTKRYGVSQVNSIYQLHFVIIIHTGCPQIVHPILLDFLSCTT